MEFEKITPSCLYVNENVAKTVVKEVCRHFLTCLLSSRIQVVSVGGSESSSGNSGDGGPQRSPRYNGAMTITASGRLLDRINRLRRDCIKALGFNVLAQVWR